MNSFVYEFFSASFLMGLAIGLDAAVATGVKANALDKPRIALYWLAGITLTHTLFPMVGYLMSYYGLQEYPVFTPLLGIAAFYLIALYVYEEYRQIDSGADKSPGEGVNPNYLISLGLILAVSWDALWSGPAKSAQVIEWPPYAVWVSFLIVGATVSMLSTLAFFLSTRLVRDVAAMWDGNTMIAAQWVQLTAVSYFGWLALSRYTLQWDLSAFHLLLFSALSTGVILWRLHSPILLQAER